MVVLAPCYAIRLMGTFYLINSRLDFKNNSSDFLYWRTDNIK